MKALVLIFAGLIINLVPVTAQDDIMTEAEIADEILSISDEYEVTALMERLAELAERPVMINSGDEEEIGRIFFLSEFQVKVLADYILNHGAIETIYEIALLPGFDRKTATLIGPYLDFNKGRQNDNIKKGSNTLLLTAISRLPENDNENFRSRFLLKYRHSSRSISFGITGENDPGEHFTFRNAWGPDFLSGYMMYQGKGLTERVIVGDFSLCFGEGITLNNNSGFGNRLVSPSFMTGRQFVSPFTSTDENNFFRGMACIIGKVTGGAVLFFSSNKIDARLSFSPSDSSVYVTSLVKSGLHDTESGLASRNSLTETIAGIHISGGTPSFRGGITASYTCFSDPFSADTLDAASLFNFRGDRLINLGADMKAGTGNLLFFSETALSIPGSWASLAGIRASPAPRVTFNILARYYAIDYYSFHSRAFSSSPNVSNEEGLAANIHIEAARHLFISAGVDIYHRLWSAYRTSGPSSGSRIGIECEYSPSDNLSLKLSYRALNREYDMAGGTGVSSSARNINRQVTAHFMYTPLTGICLNTRLLISQDVVSGGKGYLLCQDIAYTPAKMPLRFWIRYSLFSTDSFDTRLYAWENDLLQSFNIPALYGEGSRNYLMISWKPFKKAELRCKYGITAKSSPLERSMSRELRVQVKMSF